MFINVWFYESAVWFRCLSIHCVWTLTPWPHVGGMALNVGRLYNSNLDCCDAGLKIHNQ